MHYDDVKDMLLDAEVSIDDYGNFCLGAKDGSFIEIYSLKNIEVLNKFEFTYDMVRYDVRKLVPLC